MRALGVAACAGCASWARAAREQGVVRELAAAWVEAGRRSRTEERGKSNNGGKGSFVEIRAGAARPAPGSDASCSDLSGEELDAMSDISEELDAEREGNIREDGGGDAPKEYSSAVISSVLSGISFDDVSSDCADAASSKLRISGRTSEESSKHMRPFKPKAINFLPVATGSEAEKVDLRHQAVNDRRGAELRKAVKKLAHAQKRKVEMLVQAFETVLPMGATKKKAEWFGEEEEDEVREGKEVEEDLLNGLGCDPCFSMAYNGRPTSIYVLLKDL
ncbi:hypothetical protein EJB05_48855, partial [Eragrostis curvula]